MHDGNVAMHGVANVQLALGCVECDPSATRRRDRRCDGDVRRRDNVDLTIGVAQEQVVVCVDEQIEGVVIRYGCDSRAEGIAG